MARTGVTREAVSDAVERLRRAGRDVTVRAVREALGDTGSLKTIADHLRAVRAAETERGTVALPDPLLRRLAEGATEYWAELADAAEAIATEASDRAAAEVRAAAAEREAAERRAARACEELAAHKGTIAALERHLQETTSALTEAREREAATELTLATCRERSDALANRLAGADKLLEARSAELEREREQAAIARRAARDEDERRAAEEAERDRRQRHEHERALRTVTDELAGARERLRTSDAARQRLETENEALRSERDAGRVALAAREQSLERAQARAASLEGELASLGHDLRTERERQDTRERATAEALAAQRTLIAALGERLEKLPDRGTGDGGPAA